MKCFHFRLRPGVELSLNRGENDEFDDGNERDGPKALQHRLSGRLLTRYIIAITINEDE